jgi:hypothetical protein
MATYQYSQHFGYPQQQQSDGSYPSSSSNQQQQQHQQPYQNQNQNQQSGTNFSGHDYYGFADNSAQFQQQTQAYFGQSANGINHINLNDHGNGNGNSNGHGMNGYNPPQPQFMPASYDPFELGVPTGAGMFFNPSMHYIQQQQYFNNHQQPQQPVATTNYLHRPTLESNISPVGSMPGSAQSSHLNLQSITPERQPTRTPEDDSHGSPLPTSLTGPTRSTQLARQKEGPVKAACLSCRQKKAKCDGIKPICTQASLCPPAYRMLSLHSVYKERQRVRVCEIETRWSEKEA